MKGLGKAQTFAWGIVLVGVTMLSAESLGTEPTRKTTITPRASVTPRVIVFKGNERAGQLTPAPQTSGQAPKNAAPPAQLSAAEASEMLAAAGISITPAMLGSKKPYTLTPASPRLVNGAQISFENVSQGVVGPSEYSQSGFYRFSGPQQYGGRSVDLYVPASALIVGRSYLVDFAVSCDQSATWRVYMPKGGQYITLQPGSQHVPVIVTWQGKPISLAFSLNLSNLGGPPWTFYSATVTELQ